ncbi:MAG: DUF937 domain-containing protein [Planctomycetota bacterium]
MPSMLDQISGYLDQDNVSRLSRNIGASPEVTQQAIGAVLPTLMGALARRAEQSDGQERLSQALERDHDGSILDNLGGFFDPDQDSSRIAGLNAKSMAGGAILDHILGSQKGRVGTGVSRASGLSDGQSMKLMSMLAPLLMGMLGKQKREQGLSPGGLGELLRGESRQVEQNSPAGSILGRLFDQDGDGDFDLMDIMRFGAGRLFGKR